MAQEVITKLIDDLDGTEAAETVSFAIDGEHYEIDLNDKNATALRKALDRYRAVARSSTAGRLGSARRKRGKSTRSRSDVDPRVVRAWAIQSGIEMSSRGRLPTEVLDQYKAAH